LSRPGGLQFPLQTLEDRQIDEVVLDQQGDVFERTFDPRDVDFPSVALPHHAPSIRQSRDGTRMRSVLGIRQYLSVHATGRLREGLLNGMVRFWLKLLYHGAFGFALPQLTEIAILCG